MTPQQILHASYIPRFLEVRESGKKVWLQLTRDIDLTEAEASH